MDLTEILCTLRITRLRKEHRDIIYSMTDFNKDNVENTPRYKPPRYETKHNYPT